MRTRIHFSLRALVKAGEIRLDVENHPQFVLSLPRFFQPCSGVAHVAIHTCVCSCVVFLAVPPPYQMISGPLLFSLELCLAIAVSVYSLSPFLILDPPRLPPPRHTNSVVRSPLLRLTNGRYLSTAGSYPGLPISTRISIYLR